MLKSFQKMIFIILFWAFSSLVPLASVNAFEVPAHDNYVTDIADVISETEEQELEDLFFSLRQDTDVEWAIAIIPDLQGDSVRNVWLQIAESRGIWDATSDNWFLILVAINDREASIEIGYWLEHILTDGITKRIADNNFPPYFKAGDYAWGLKAALTDIRGLIEQDELIMSYYVEQENVSIDFDSSWGLFWLSLDARLSRLSILWVFAIIFSVFLVEEYVVTVTSKKRSITSTGWRNFLMISVGLFLVFFVISFFLITSIVISLGISLFALVVGLADWSSSGGWYSSSSSSGSSRTSSWSSRSSSSSSSSSFGGFSGGSFWWWGSSTSR